MRETTCPHCGESIDVATNLKYDAPPSPGAVSICAGCGRVAKFEADLTLSVVTDDELLTLPTETLIMLWQAKQALVKSGQTSPKSRH